jgi:hypothetical protein
MADLAVVEARLRDILAPYRSRFTVTEGGSGLTLEMPGQEGKPWGFVAGTRVGKRYVSFYLMSVYGQPALLDSLSPELRKRMQGKACFNFTQFDEPLFIELEALVGRGIERGPEIVAAALAATSRRRRRAIPHAGRGAADGGH